MKKLDKYGEIPNIEIASIGHSTYVCIGGHELQGIQRLEFVAIGNEPPVLKIELNVRDISISKED